MILAPTPREREQERWCAILLLAQGWTAATTAEALERDLHTIGRWAAALGEGGPAALIFEQTGGSPPALGETQQAELRAAVRELPAESGIGLANWNWKAVCQYVSERFGISLSRSTCLNYLHHLGFAFKCPKKLSRAAAKHTTVAERKCTTGGMGDGSDLGVGVGTGTVGRGPWED